jgi:hypothetical protein
LIVVSIAVGPEAVYSRIRRATASLMAFARSSRVAGSV